MIDPDPAQPASFPVEELRKQFPALERSSGFVFADNAAGAQIPEAVLAAVNRHLVDHNVQRGGRYRHSIAVDTAIDRARASVATFVNARRPEEIAFGMNATSFIRLVSLAVGQTLSGRNEIVLTDLDHEANVATWLALERFGAKFRWWKSHSDGSLHVEDLKPLLSANTRLVACTLTSNALGSIVDVRTAADLTHAAGAEIFLDGVHYAPHGLIDVQAWDCDYLVCSGYKIFAPHMGFMWGRHESLSALPTFREDFIPDAPPGKIEAGTFIFENVAGMDAAIQYLGQIGRTIARRPGASDAQSLREDVRQGMAAIREYEQHLSLELLRVLRECGAHIYGIESRTRVTQRVPTVAFNMPRRLPQTVTEAAARAEIGIRDGHMYAPRLMRRLGVPVETGVVRISLVHYNTVTDIQRFEEVLKKLR